MFSIVTPTLQCGKHWQGKMFRNLMLDLKPDSSSKGEVTSGRGLSSSSCARPDHDRVVHAVLSQKQAQIQIATILERLSTFHESVKPSHTGVASSVNGNEFICIFSLKALCLMGPPQGSNTATLPTVHHTSMHNSIRSQLPNPFRILPA